MSTYYADNLEDIAELFEFMASRAKMMTEIGTATERKRAAHEEVIWKQAASMLRQTTLKPQEPSK